MSKERLAPTQEDLSNFKRVFGLSKMRKSDENHSYLCVKPNGMHFFASYEYIITVNSKEYQKWEDRVSYEAWYGDRALK